LRNNIIIILFPKKSNDIFTYFPNNLLFLLTYALFR